MACKWKLIHKEILLRIGIHYWNRQFRRTFLNDPPGLHYIECVYFNNSPKNVLVLMIIEMRLINDRKVRLNFKLICLHSKDLFSQWHSTVYQLPFPRNGTNMKRKRAHPRLTC